MNKVKILKFDALKVKKPEYAIVGSVDLVAVRMDENE